MGDFVIGRSGSGRRICTEYATGRLTSFAGASGHSHDRRQHRFCGGDRRVHRCSAAAFSRIAYPEMQQGWLQADLCLGRCGRLGLSWDADPAVCIADRLGHVDGDERRRPVHRRALLPGVLLATVVCRLRDHRSGSETLTIAPAFEAALGSRFT